METILEKDTDLYMTIFMLQGLCYKGISIPDTVRMSLNSLIQWYEETQDVKYIDTAVLQLRALFEMGMMRERDIGLYDTVCELAGWKEEERIKKRMFNIKKIKANKSQVKSIIRKWMPSRNNRMTITEVVDDILDKVKEKKIGQYYYRYERKTTRRNVIEGEDIYKLVVEAEQSFLLDLKGFKCYTFEI